MDAPSMQQAEGTAHAEALLRNQRKAGVAQGQKQKPDCPSRGWQGRLLPCSSPPLPLPQGVSWGNPRKGNLWIRVTLLCTDCPRRDADGPAHSKTRQRGRSSKQAWHPGLDPAPMGKRTPLQQSFCFSKDLPQPCLHSHLFCFLSDFYLFLNWGLLTVRLMHF